MQVQPEEDGQVRVSAQRLVLTMPIEKQDDNLMLIMLVKKKGDVYATSPSNAKNETSKNSKVPVQLDASMTYNYTYTSLTKSITNWLPSR